MASIATVDIKVTAVKYCFVFFPVATLTKINDISELTVFGFPVYQKVGSAVRLFGIDWSG